jgi:hypothetical protein
MRATGGPGVSARACPHKAAMSVASVVASGAAGSGDSQPCSVPTDRATAGFPNYWAPPPSSLIRP